MWGGERMIERHADGERKCDRKRERGEREIKVSVCALFIRVIRLIRYRSLTGNCLHKKGA